jgi:hypothetical protein
MAAFGLTVACWPRSLTGGIPGQAARFAAEAVRQLRD